MSDMWGSASIAHKDTRDSKWIDVYSCSVCGIKFLSNLDKDNDYENGFMYETSPESDDDIEKVLLSCKGDDMRRVAKS